MAEMPHAIRFELDARAERAVARLRLTAALLVTFAGVWLLALPYAVPRAFAIAGLAFAALWIARALRERGRRNPEEHYLEVDAEGLRMQDGAHVQEVRWRDVSAVYVDEDRLVVRVIGAFGPALEIEPRYRGVGLHDLFETVRRAHAGARERD